MTNAYSIDTSVSKQAQKHNRTKSFDEFLLRAKTKFGNRFVYSKATYQNTQKKMEITCKKHGSFWQTPYDHLRDRTKHACLKCSKESFRTTHVDFVDRARVVHENTYDYPKGDLGGLHDFVSIVCPKHGLFQQRAYSHLAGFGCNNCANEGNRKNTEEFIKRAQAVHGVDTYNYSKVVYTTHLTEVEIICHKHGAFLQRPASHTNQGSGCPICVRQNRGWERSAFKGYCDKNNNGRGVLYVIRCKKGAERFYKIGITSRGIGKRFYPSNLPYDYDVNFLIIEGADFIYDLEFRLHDLLRDYKYTPNVSFVGDTECFSDIRGVNRLLKELSSSHQYQLVA